MTGLDIGFDQGDVTGIRERARRVVVPVSLMPGSMSPELVGLGVDFRASFAM